MEVNRIKKLAIDCEQISPKVLRCYLFNQSNSLGADTKLEGRYIYDYEMEFFLESTGGMWIDDKLYSVSKGDIVFRRPGQYTQGIMPYTCYAIIIDLLGNTGKKAEEYDYCNYFGKQEFQSCYINPVLDALPTIFHTNAFEKYYPLFDNILQEFINPGEASSMLLKSLVIQILYQFHTDVKNPLAGSSLPASPYYTALKKTAEYIRSNLHRKILLEELAETAALSPTYFHSIFTQTMGTTPNDFITELRLAKAKEMLVKTKLQISEVGMECGFENIPYFSFVFHKHIGISPREFRKRYNSFEV